MSVKTKPITVRVSPEVFEYLGERAEKEHRTLSNTVNTILIEAKEAGGRHYKAASPEVTTSN